jgi:hypothetical protein
MTNMTGSKLHNFTPRENNRLLYRLIHGHFYIGLVIIPRPPYWPETGSRFNKGRGVIIRPICKCPCIKLFITHCRHLEKRHPYWPETKSRHILAHVFSHVKISIFSCLNYFYITISVVVTSLVVLQHRR